MLGGFLNKFDGGVEILDDLDDHWTARGHKAERNWFVRELQELAAGKSVRITILGSVNPLPSWTSELTQSGVTFISRQSVNSIRIRSSAFQRTETIDTCPTSSPRPSSTLLRLR